MIAVPVRRNFAIGAAFAVAIVLLATAERLLVREASAQPTVQAPRFAVDPFCVACHPRERIALTRHKPGIVPEARRLNRIVE